MELERVLSSKKRLLKSRENSSKSEFNYFDRAYQLVQKKVSFQLLEFI